jgi:hypothetical protein
MTDLGHPAAEAPERDKHDSHRRADTECSFAIRSTQSLFITDIFIIPMWWLDSDRSSGGRACRPRGSRGAGRSMTLIGADGSIGEDQPAALASTDHGFNVVAEESACGGGVAQFARPFQVFPGDLEGLLKQLGK